jgi:ATP-dependent Lon protease
VSKLDRRKTSLEAALEELPLFPLPQVVLFPRASLPLHVFEQRYRKMVADCLDGHGAMAVVLVTQPQIMDRHGNPSIARVAGAGLLLEHQPLPDGRSNILVVGQVRVELEELPFGPPYRRARARVLRDIETPVPSADLAALLGAATNFAHEVRKRDRSFAFDLPSNVAPGTAADLCAHHLVIDVEARQRVLEELDVANRVRIVTAELAAQHTALVGAPAKKDALN